MHKFRSMVHEPENLGSLITGDLDNRITRIGKFLRRYKIDELPQLIDVLKGDMSVVGPRPEVPRLIEYYPMEIKTIVLSVRPGITDIASIVFRNESVLLGKSVNPEQEYIDNILPKKLTYYQQYVKDQSLVTDLRIIVNTIISVFLAESKDLRGRGVHN
jgi:lipopolysaccharide/colanic/teichoic acid biosynthesis glycosyltransferase